MENNQANAQNRPLLEQTDCPREKIPKKLAEVSIHQDSSEIGIRLFLPTLLGIKPRILMATNCTSSFYRF